jgi:hypothetical protein
MNILHTMEQTRRRGGRRNPNGDVTMLLKEFFSGLVNFNGRTEPLWTWKHSVTVLDTPDQDRVEHDNCLEPVEETFWVFFCYINPLAYSRKVH